MQALGFVTTPDLLQKGQESLLKLEIFVSPDWINICSLDGKNYLKSISVSHGGAGMSPNPIAAKLSAEISNEGGIFHPKHPDSAYTDYFKAGRKVRISVGAEYNEIAYYWQRIIGYIDIPKFSLGKIFTIRINGLDYTKLLTDMVFKKTAVPPENYWGSSITLSTIASEETLGAEMYNEADAMDIANEVNTVANWDRLFGATIASVADGAAPGGTHVGEVIKDNGGAYILGYAENNNIDTVEQGKEYKVVFQYLKNAATAGNLSVGIYKTGTVWTNNTPKVVGDTVEPTIPNTNNCFYICTVAGTTAGAEPAPWPTVENGGIVDGTVTWATQYMDGKKMGEIIGLTSAVYVEETFYFTATESCVIKMRLTVKGGAHIATMARVDVISIKEITGWSNARYNLPDECNGIHYAVLDGVAIWPGEQRGEGWFYDPINNKFYFSEDRHFADPGTNNLVIYYYTQQIPENVIADILVTMGLYVNQAAALSAMQYTATGITIDQVWFKAGSKYLNAMKLICERCDYRFFFKWNGIPVFKPVPSPKAAGFEDMEFRKWHISNPKYYEDRNEIRNRIVIEGLKQALPEGADETMPSELKDEASDATSISAYGEHTLSINNHLFQDITSLTAMCATLLVRYKDPKWYLDFKTDYNPAPLEIWDTIKAELMLKGPIWPGGRYGTFRYSSGVLYGGSGTLVDVRALIRDIKINKYDITYKSEEVI